MQQVLKSREVLHMHNTVSTFRGCIDCGECSERRIIEPMATTKKWFGLDHDPLNQNDLKAVKRFAKACAAVFVVAQVVYWLIGGAP